MRTNIRPTEKISIFLLLVGLLTFALLFLVPKAHAAYTAGRVMDDGEFLNAKSMSIADIQLFLTSKNSGLKNMNFVLSCYGSGSKERQLYTAAGAQCDTPIPASQIIYYAAQIYGVNPKVILVTMQKEQSLTTSPNPTSWQLNQAMGYGCPTSGSCSGDSAFPWQIDSGTWALRYHFERARRNMTWWTASTSWTCGTEKNLYKPNLYPGQDVRFYDTNGTHYTTVFIHNPATSSMYCYTPHAYNNPQGLYGRAPYGTTGLYYSGSWNFVYFYELWFGSTTGSYPLLDASAGGPRWMVTNKDTNKLIPSTNEPSYDPADTTVAAGTQLRFIDKIWANNKWYLRTEYDHARNLFKGIPQEDISDIQATAFHEPRYMMLKTDAHKFNPRSIQQQPSGIFPSGMIMKFDAKFLVNGKWFYRTEFDTANQNVSAFFATSVIELSFTSFDSPRALTVEAGSSRLNLRSGNVVSTYGSNIDVAFKDKINVNGQWYYRTETDSLSGQPIAISSDNLAEIPHHRIATPYTIEILSNSQKRSLVYGSPLGDDTLTAGQSIKVVDIVTLNGTVYYRSEHDSDRNLQKGILVNDTKIAAVNFVPLDKPRAMTLLSTVPKKNLLTGNPVGSSLPAGTKLFFSTKTEIKGKWYVRTQFDTNHNLQYGIEIENVNTND